MVGWPLGFSVVFLVGVFSRVPVLGWLKIENRKESQRENQRKTHKFGCQKRHPDIVFVSMRFPEMDLQFWLL